MKLAYIAGPFRAKNAWQVECNVRAAEKTSFVIAQMNIAAICPHANGRFFNGTLTDEYWLESTAEMLKRCDMMILVDYISPEVSEGTASELKIARSLDIPVFFVVDNCLVVYDGDLTK